MAQRMEWVYALKESGDAEDKIKEFLPSVDDLFEKSGSGGMVTIERADIVRYSPGKKQKG